MVPLRAVSAVGLGATSCSWVDAMGRQAKRATPGTPKRVASACSSGSSFAARASSPVLGGVARVAVHEAVSGVEGVASLFGTVGLPKESSDDGTPSHMYDEGSKDTVVVAPPRWPDATGVCSSPT